MRRKPVFCDVTARLREDRPPHLPAPGHALHGQAARLAGIWLRRYAARKPRVPLSWKADLRIKSWIAGRRPVYVAEFRLIHDYVVSRKQEAKMRTQVTLNLFSLRGFNLTR